MGCLHCLLPVLQEGRRVIFITFCMKLLVLLSIFLWAILDVTSSDYFQPLWLPPTISSLRLVFEILQNLLHTQQNFAFSALLLPDLLSQLQKASRSPEDSCGKLVNMFHAIEILWSTLHYGLQNVDDMCSSTRFMHICSISKFKYRLSLTSDISKLLRKLFF